MRKRSGKQDRAQEPSSKTYIYLMTDVVRSTPLWQEDWSGMSACVKALDDIVERAARDNGGRLVRERGEGDSHLLVFGIAEPALLAAVQIGVRLRDDPALERIVLRSAVHAGDSDFRSGDFYGSAPNLCSRMRAVANPGQILVSDVVRLLSPASKDIAFKPLGSHRLRDLPNSEDLFQLLHPGLPCDFPPLRSTSSGLHNLPVFLTSFVGRSDDVANVSELVLTSRLTTVTGPGGVGKTRLALRVAETCEDQFEGGVWFVDLTRTATEQGVLSALCSVFESNLITDERSLIGALANQHALLIVDNCEQVDQECRGILKRLLSACPDICVLATSRKLLKVYGERVYLLGSLALPSEGEV